MCCHKFLLGCLQIYDIFDWSNWLENDEILNIFFYPTPANFKSFY